MEFLKVVFTPADPFDDEPEALEMLLDSGAADIIHLRHPGASEMEIRGIISGIPTTLRRKIRIHDHFGLAAELGLGGVHLNGRNPLPPAAETSVSGSCHSVRDVLGFVEKYPRYTYVTLSPVYDSISKEGYLSARFAERDIVPLTSSRRVVALGGIAPRHFRELSWIGFIGAAMLGYIWSNPEGKKLPEIVEEINNAFR